MKSSSRANPPGYAVEALLIQKRVDKLRADLSAQLHRRDLAVKYLRHKGWSLGEIADLLVISRTLVAKIVDRDYLTS